MLTRGCLVRKILNALGYLLLNDRSQDHEVLAEEGPCRLNGDVVIRIDVVKLEAVPDLLGVDVLT